jgi:hypothetical protein
MIPSVPPAKHTLDEGHETVVSALIPDGALWVDQEAPPFVVAMMEL